MTILGKRLAIGTLLTLGAALPAAAQEGICGGIGATGQWLGGDEATSDISTAASHLEQTALVLMNTNYVGMFTLSAPGQVRIEAEAQGVGDTVIDIWDATGTIVASDDDSGGNAASRTEPSLAAGTYCVAMRSYDGGPLTAFVRVGRMEHEALTDGFLPIDDVPYEDPYAPGSCDTSMMADIGGGQPLDAARLGEGATLAIAPMDNRFVGFTLSEPAALTITADNEMADPRIMLFDSYGYFYQENDDYTGLNAQIDLTYPMEAGTYCMVLDSWSDTSLPVDVTVRAYDPVAALMAMYMRGEASPPLDGSYPVTMLGELAGRLRKDIQTTGETTWFALDVPEGGLLVIEAINNGLGDPTLVLFDDFGRQLAYNDDSGEGLDSMLTTRVLPGTYVVGVRQLSANSAPVLTRLLFERFVSPQ
jgi:hypothetical protein